MSTPAPVPDPTAFEAWGLAAAWVGSGAAVVSVVVAAVFGYLTLANTRRSKAAQDTATYAAAQEPATGSVRGVLPVGPDQITWRIDRASGGERWVLINDGSADAFEVVLRGLTDIDQQRLQASEEAAVLPSADAVGFTFVSRLTLSGPGNIVVSWRSSPGGLERSKVLRVPAE